MEVKQHKTKKPKYPAWFAYFVEHEFKPLQKLVYDIIKYNNLKTHE